MGEVREVIRKVPKPILQYVDKQIPVSVMKYTEKIVPYAVTIEEERPLEVPQVLTVEITTQRPNPQYQQIPTVELRNKEVICWETQVVEKVVEVPHVLREEVAVEVPQIQTCEVLRQDAVAQTKEVIKQIPRVQMQYRERVVELRDQVRQEQVVVPQVQMVEYV